MSELTNLEFARRAASIAAVSSGWARDILMPYEEGLAKPDSVARFVADIQQRLDWIMETAALTPLPEGGQ